MANCVSAKVPPLKTKEEVALLIEKELPLGASGSAIEEFFRKNEISFSWDKFAQRYVAIIRNVEPFHSITIDIFVDSKRRFVKSEVTDSYTAP